MNISDQQETFKGKKRILDEESEIRSSIRMRLKVHLRVAGVLADYTVKLLGNDPPEKERLSYVRDLVEPSMESTKALYRPDFGYVTLMCGTGDCNQLGMLRNAERNIYTADATLESRIPRPNEDLVNVPLIQVACGGLHNLALKATGQVLSWGCNDAGALGRHTFSSEEAQLNPACEFMVMPVASPVSGKMGIITHVACGDNQSLAVELDGKVWAWGCYRNSQGDEFKDIPFGTNLQDASEDKRIELMHGHHMQPVHVKGFEQEIVAEVACGDNFSAARTLSGDLFTWGVNERGETGRRVVEVKDERKKYNYDIIAKEWMTPRPPMWAGGISRKVEAVACGSFHMLVLAAAGQHNSRYTTVFSCGLNNRGQLGLKDYQNRDELTQIEILPGCNIRKVAAGTFHSLCVDVDGFLFAFGGGNQSQLGVTHTKEPDENFTINRPVRVSLGNSANFQEEERVYKVACGGAHSLIITRSGSVYTWGYGDNAQLGHGGTPKDEYRPRKVDFSRSLARDDVDIHVIGVDGGGQHSSFLCRVTKKVNPTVE